MGDGAFDVKTGAMTPFLRLCTAVLLVGAFASCNGSSGSSAATRDGGDGGGVDASQDGSFQCHEGETVPSVPAGACTTGATCHLSVDHKIVCPDGYVPPHAPVDFSCACPGSAWECQAVGGGFNLPTCDGHEGGAEDAGTE